MEVVDGMEPDPETILLRFARPESASKSSPLRIQIISYHDIRKQFVIFNSRDK